MPIIDIAGRPLYYQDTGKDAPAIVLVHGFLMDHRMFAPIVAALEDEFRVIAYDTRGFGQSGWDGKPFDLYDEVADCVALLDHLGVEQAVIGGMSRGGYIALRLALRHPERVRALVLISTRASADEEPVRALYRQTRDAWRDHGPIDPIIDGLAGGILGPQETVGELWKTWQPAWRSYDPQAIAAGMDAMIERDELEDRLGEIPHPALVIHGDADVGVPVETGIQLADKLPGARGLLRYPDGHHSVALTHAAAIIPPLRDFLRAHGR
ncbi:MAG: alpha/beta hydrolase [bacterium]